MNNLHNLSAAELSELIGYIDRMRDAPGTITMRDLARAMDLYWGPPVEPPAERVTLETSVAQSPACHPMAPCGCYGCAVCNGAQAPIYGYASGSTPALGVPAISDIDAELHRRSNACTRYNPCGDYQCQKCFPGQILPPDMRGKPNGGGSKATKAANAEKGYRVCPYATWLNARDGERPGERFSTPDLATQRARRDAKAGGETYLVLRDGARWKLLKSDGDEVVIG